MKIYVIYSALPQFSVKTIGAEKEKRRGLAAVASARRDDRRVLRRSGVDKSLIIVVSFLRHVLTRLSLFSLRCAARRFSDGADALGPLSRKMRASIDIITA